MKINCEKGMVNRGLWGRIKDVFNKGDKGERLNIAFIGGSITQGCNATTHEGSYAYLTYQWFVNKFPNANINYINAGIGGTTSHFGVARLHDDVLSKNPDMVFIEFSVNDESSDFFKESYEGLVRAIYYSEAKPAVMLIHNIKYDDGFNSFDKHIEIGKYYKLPCVSMIPTIYEEVKSGNINALDITTDYLHPNDIGHKMVCSVICYYLEEIYKDRLIEEDMGYQLLEAITENGFENAKRYQCRNIAFDGSGFQSDEREKEYFTDNFKGGWIAHKEGDYIHFKIKGSSIAVQYKQTINKPAPIAEAIVDGKAAIILDANFTEDWGDNLKLENVLVHGENKEHDLLIRIKESHEDDKSEFYLLSIIVA